MGSNSLIVKDGNSDIKTLSVFSSSLGFIPEHAISGTINVSASATSPVYVTGNVSITQPVNVDLNLSDQLTVVVSSSENTNAVWITSSANYPAFVNINNTASAYVVGTASVTASMTNPVATKEKLATNLTFSQFAVGTGSGIDWTSTGSLNMSGTFIIAQSSSARSGLMFTNNFPVNLYVVYDTGYSDNGFGFFVSTASAPYQYSFVLYPNGTYIADPSFVNVKHSGYFPSSSAITNQTLNVYSTE